MIGKVGCYITASYIILHSFFKIVQVASTECALLLVKIGDFSD